MELEELKERYKMLSMFARISIAAILGLLPAVYVYFDEGEALQSQLDQATSEEEVARSQFERARQKKANLPKLEEQLAFTEEQLTKARKKLPESFRIEEVLQRTATIAKEVSIKLNVFAPETQVVSGSEDFRYMEMPIRTEVEGQFSDLAAFFDRMVHLEQSVFVRDIELSTLVPESDNRSNVSKSPHELAKEVRSALQVSGKFKLVAFRALSEGEAQTHEKGQGESGNAPKAPKSEDASALPAPSKNANQNGGS